MAKLGKLRPSSKRMTVTPDGTFYPQEGNPSPPAGTHGATTTAGNSTFKVGGDVRDAVVYSIHVGSATLPSSFALQSHDGTQPIGTLIAAAAAGSSLNFGPEGIVLAGGFRVVKAGGDPAAFCTVVYDIL